MVRKPYNIPMRFTARNDYAFKKLFGTEENKDIMIEFISLVTLLSKDDFGDVHIENSEQIPQFYNQKTGRLDMMLRCRTHILSITQSEVFFTVLN